MRHYSHSGCAIGRRWRGKVDIKSTSTVLELPSKQKRSKDCQTRVCISHSSFFKIHLKGTFPSGFNVFFYLKRQESFKSIRSSRRKHMIKLDRRYTKPDITKLCLVIHESIFMSFPTLSGHPIYSLICFRPDSVDFIPVALGKDAI